MKIQYIGKVWYTVDEGHPDIKYIEGWTKDKVYTFQDTYFFDMNFIHCEEEIKNYILNDLLTVAGGGYNKSHIHYVNFSIQKIYK